MRRVVSICVAAMFIGVAIASRAASVEARAGDRPPGRTSERSSNEPELRAYVYPAFARAPARVRIQAVVVPNEENRTLEFVVDSFVYYRSSVIELAGGHAARSHVAEFRSVPAGTHEVRVVVRDSTGKARASLHDRIVIVE